jgi:hypothetical protein
MECPNAAAAAPPHDENKLSNYQKKRRCNFEQRSAKSRKIESKEDATPSAKVRIAYSSLTEAISHRFSNRPSSTIILLEQHTTSRISRREYSNDSETIP